MDIFEKLAEFSNETFSALKWIFLFVSCSAFFASLLALKPSKKDVSKAVTFSSTVSFAVAACGFVYCDIIDMVCKLINCNAGLFTTIVGILFVIPALSSSLGLGALLKIQYCQPIIEYTKTNKAAKCSNFCLKPMY